MKLSSERDLDRAFSISAGRASLGSVKTLMTFAGSKNRPAVSFSRITQNPSAAGKPAESPIATPEAYPVFFEDQFGNGQVNFAAAKDFAGAKS